MEREAEVESPLAVVTAYGPKAASARVRAYEWLEHLGLAAEHYDYIGSADNQPRTLARHPLKTLGAEAYRSAMIRRVAGRTLLLGRRASPFSRGGFERRLLESAGRGVYDFDDALYAGSAKGLNRLWSTADVWRAAVGTADVVVAGSALLANEADRFARDVRVIPSCIAPEKYLLKDDYELSEVPRAVWLGTPATEGFLGVVAPALLALNRSHGLRLELISRGEAPLGELEEIVDRVEWSAETALPRLNQSDFGIMPLPDTPYTRGKCAYKLLQYSAAGLPAVASPVGANREALAAVGGSAADSIDEWVGAIEELIGLTSEDRARRGRQAREGVVAAYSFSAWEREWTAAMGLTLDPA